MNAVRRAATALRWYVRQLTGEGKWDEYVATCAATGERPVSRREFERRRDHEREHAPGARCC
ncbi:CstA-like transporter-associated (seleno)protein [Nocardioides sediminis]|uniref:CstA-like transporter-associated (seleno)protein n=1 Tax=Nocardioides sediminis TaxID=433648 RepID=UPI000D306931|nr:YbdD/YjiX family protein [Nocardioides sediminis]